jgi:hypothetical protein
VGRTGESVDALLEALPEPDRPAMAVLDRHIVVALTGRSRTFWRGTFWGGTEQAIIGYGDIVQPRPKRPDVEGFAVGLARQKRNLSLYVNAVEDGPYIGRAYADRLGKVKAGAASLSFRRLEDIDLAVLDELLAHIERVTPR